MVVWAASSRVATTQSSGIPSLRLYQDSNAPDVKREMSPKRGPAEEEHSGDAPDTRSVTGLLGINPSLENAQIAKTHSSSRRGPGKRASSSAARTVKASSKDN